MISSTKKLSNKWLFAGAALAALLQSGILYASIEKRASVLRSGREIVLLTEPVDPRDLMRGDYVILGYDISSILRKDIQGAAPAGKPSVFVAVKRDTDGNWKFSRASFSPIADPSADEVVLAGQSRYRVYGDNDDSAVLIEYGIERYYEPEGEGREIEAHQRDKRITVVVAVSADGIPVIKSLRDNGKQLYDEPLY